MKIKFTNRIYRNKMKIYVLFSKNLRKLNNSVKIFKSRRRNRKVKNKEVIKMIIQIMEDFLVRMIRLNT